MTHEEIHTVRVDNSTLNKPTATSIRLATHDSSGKHHAAVADSNLATLVWEDGDLNMPCDCRLDDKTVGRTRGDHYAATVGDTHAHARSRHPAPLRGVRRLAR